MAGFAEVATTGILTSATGLKVPAVAKEKLPANGDNPLLRSWEYSVASLAATEAGSRERRLLMGNLMAPRGLGEVEAIVGTPDWKKTKAKLEMAIGEAFLFEYDPVSKITSNDGSSSTGRYVILPKDAYAGPAGKPIITKDAFVAAMTAVAIKAMDLKPEDANHARMVDLITSDAFIAAICPGKNTPWEMSSGGMELGPTKTLFGGTPATSVYIPMVDSKAPPPPEGARTEAVLNALLGAIGATGDRYVNIGTEGIHSFNAVPQMGMTALIGATPGETATRVSTALIAPGRKIADTAMPAAKGAVIFDRMIDAAYASSDDAQKETLLQAKTAHRPTTDMMPAQIRDAFAKASAEADKLKAAYQVMSKIAIRTKDIAARRAEASPKPGFDGVTFDKDAKVELDTFTVEQEKVWDDYFKTETEGTTRGALMTGLGVPQVVLADTNWGSPETHTYFVAAPDPVTGDLRLWQRTEPGGKMTPAPRKWIDTGWDKTQ